MSGPTPLALSGTGPASLSSATPLALSGTAPAVASGSGSGPALLSGSAPVAAPIPALGFQLSTNFNYPAVPAGAEHQVALARRNVLEQQQILNTNGVGSPGIPQGRPVTTHQGADQCPICGKRCPTRDNIRSHFRACVAHNGNPTSLCWNENINLTAGTEAHEERELLRQHRRGVALGHQGQRRLEHLRYRRVIEATTRLRNEIQSQLPIPPLRFPRAVVEMAEAAEVLVAMGHEDPFDTDDGAPQN